MNPMRIFCRHKSRANSTGGSEARKRAEHELERVRSETPYYAGLGDDLRRLRERNHFADNIRATMRET